MYNFARLMHTIQKMMTVRNYLLKKKVDECVISWDYIPILSYIKANPMCTQTEIAEEFSKTPAAITLSTQKLEKQGLIEKHIDKENLRVKRLTVTEEGKKLVKESVDVFDNIDLLMRKDISDEELENFYNVLYKMYKNLLTDSGMDEPKVKPWD